MSKRNVSTVMERLVVGEESQCGIHESIPPVSKYTKFAWPVEPLHAILLCIDPQIVRTAPIYSYLRLWFDGRYSHQCLCRMIQRVYEQELYGVTDGLPEFRDIHAANVALLKHMLFALVWSAESERAA